MKEVSSVDCQTVINKISESGLSYTSVKKAYDAMNALFKHALIQDDIIKNPMLAVKLPPSSEFEKKDVRALSEDEVSKMLEELKKTWKSSGNLVYTYGQAFNLILNTGLRCGECIALDWSDVDLDAEILHVRKTSLFVKERDKNGKPTHKSIPTIQSTKSKSGKRDIPLNKKAIAALKILRDEYPNSEFILTTTQGTRISYNTLDKQFN
jgi:integrase